MIKAKVEVTNGMSHEVILGDLDTSEMAKEWSPGVAKSFQTCFKPGWINVLGKPFNSKVILVRDGHGKLKVKQSQT